MRTLKFYSISLALFFVVLLASSVFSQKPQALLDFYKLEQDNWLEYIQRFPDCDEPEDFDITFYYIDVEVAIESSYIQGSVYCKFESCISRLDEIQMNLHNSLDIDSIAGNAEDYFCQNDSIFIELDDYYMPGESFEITIYYQGVPVLAGGMKGLRYETHGANEPIIATLSTPFLAHYWWPCKDGPGDKPDSVYIDVTIPDTVIAGYELIVTSNGTLDNVIVNNGKKTFQWRERFPIVSYYVNMVISNYHPFQETYNGNYGETFDLVYYVFNENYSSSQTGVQNMPEVVDVFSELFGVYPFHPEKYANSELGYYGAIEKQTNTIINNLQAGYFDVVIHEFSHMWFGDMITCRDWHHGWLNEGFATYAEALWAEHNGGFSAYQSNMASNYYTGGGTLYLQNISNPFNIFISIIYQKGAYVLHMLRGVLGDDDFFESLMQYANDPELMYDHAVTEDFQAHCEDVSGMDLEFFFDQWIYDEYYPQYVYTYNQNQSTYNVNVEIRQIQGNYGRRPVFEMPVQLKFNYFAGGDTMVTVWNDEQIQEFTIDLDQRISNVEFDPDDWILKSVNYVSVEDTPENVTPAIFGLSQNIPNPFNQSTILSFEMRDAGFVSLDIFDITGRLVGIQNFKPLHEWMSAGKHHIVFDAGDLGSGIYLVRMEAEDFTSTRKILLLK